MTKVNATVVILTKNEADSIVRAINSAKSFKRVIVVDSSSTDDTVNLATSAGAEVINFEWDQKYPKKKEWSAAHPRVETDWVVFLDADETLTESLVDEVSNIIAGGQFAAIDVPLSYIWQGRELRHGHRVLKRIAYRRSLARWPRPDDLDVQNMWEVEGHYQPQTTGDTSRSVCRIEHDDTGSLYEYFARQNRYTDWEAWVLEGADDQAVNSRSNKGRLAARLPFKPTLFFFYSYVFRMGLLDGRSGLEYALSHAFYHWQVGLKRAELRRIRGLPPE